MTTATFDEAAAQTHNLRARSIQTDTVTEVVSHPYTEDEAAAIVQRTVRRFIMRRRMIVYRTLRGMLYARKYAM